MESKIFWDEFLDMYKCLPELWNTKSKDYKNPQIREQALKTLIDKLKEIYPDADRKMVTSKINTFRTNYRRDMRKVSNSVRSGASADDVFKSSLWYFSKLAFLNGCDDSIPGNSTMDESFEIDETPKKKKKPLTESDKLMGRMAKDLIQQRSPSPDNCCCLKKVKITDSKQVYIRNRIVNEVSFAASMGELEMSHMELICNILKFKNCPEPPIPAPRIYLPTPKFV